MKNKIICRILFSVIMILISLIIFEISFFIKYNNEDYLSGFVVGFLSVNVMVLIKNIIALKNPKKLKKIEVVEKDERLIKIVNDAYALTFRIVVLIEALVSVIALILGKFNISTLVGVIIGLQMIILFITYVVLSKKN